MSHDRRDDRGTISLTFAGAMRAACLGACLGMACAAGTARAQTSGNLTLVSEYAVRGVSLGAGRPALQLRIDHDAPGGWYAGGFVTPAVLGEAHRQAEYIVYGGRAGQLPSGLSWDAGISRAAFTRDHDYDYLEFHAGLALDRASARLLVSPAYYGADPSAYLDLNAFYPLDERWRLTAHAGLMHGFGDDPGTRADLRLGLAATLGDLSLQLGWQTLLRPAGMGPPRARALSASAGLRF